MVMSIGGAMCGRRLYIKVDFHRNQVTQSLPEGITLKLEGAALSRSGKKLRLTEHVKADL